MRCAAILLAAGAGARFGEPNKLTAGLGGKPLVRHAGDMLSECSLASIAAVTGRDRTAVEAALSGLDLTFVHNPRWEDGMGGSIAAGVTSLSEDVDAAFIVPGDMPFLTQDVLAVLAAVSDKTGPEHKIVFPLFDGHIQTNPVLWPRRFFGSLAQLSGPVGAKPLLIRNAADTRGIAFDDPSVFKDIDTAADLEAARARLVSHSMKFS